MFREWVRHSLQRRLLVSLTLGVGLTLAAFQIAVDQIVDRYIERHIDAHGTDLAGRERLLREVDLILFGGLITVMGAAALATLLAVRRGLKPLERVAAAAHKISVDQPAYALPLTSVPAEIQPLCDRFNELIERLAEALEHERRFGTDLAHELRTPLAEIRTLGQASLACRDVERLHGFLRQTTAAAVGMQGVVESLLAVARADRAAVEQALEPIAVSAAVNARLERLRITAPEDCSRIVSHVPAEIWVQTDPRLFDAMLINILANAIQHGDPGLPIEIDWQDGEAGHGTGVLRVRNSASRLEDMDLPHLTERFWRGAPDKSSAESPGLGLGLWVVRRLCVVLGLQLALKLDESGCLSVYLKGLRVL